MSTPEWLPKAIELYENGMPYYKIGELLGHNRKTVSYHLRKAGYKSNPLYAKKINPGKLAKYNYSVAEKVFEKIDTEEKAYWLGFLYADGHVDDNKHTVSLCLKESDLYVIKKFRSFLGLDDKKIHKKIKHNNKKSYISYEISASNQKLCDCLYRLGCFANKTFSICFPRNIIPNSLLHHFIRGYFDGDGCVSHSGKNGSKITIEMIGTKDFLEGYQKWTGFPHKLYGFNHSDISRSLYGGAKAIIILDRLYDGATIFLKEKYDKYVDLRRLAVTSSKRTARELADKIGRGLTASTEVTTAQNA